MKPVFTPNLPDGPVGLVAVSAQAPDVVATLVGQGIEAVKIAPTSNLPWPVASHADLQLLHLGQNRVLLSQEASNIVPILQQHGFITELLSKPLGECYPNDISLNFLLLKNRCLGLCSNIPLQLLNFCNYTGLQQIPVKQGYARCSVAVVAQNAVMTADRPLAGLFTAAGLDVLMLAPGGIRLDGYDTGFIGGCCGLIDKHRLAFTGNLKEYRSGNEVLAFLQKYHVTPVYLTAGELRDIGGILPLALQECCL